MSSPTLIRGMPRRYHRSTTTHASASAGAPPSDPQAIISTSLRLSSTALIEATYVKHLFRQLHAEEVATQHLRNFRQFLEMTVCRVTPLLLDALTRDEFHDAIRTIPVPPVTPQWKTGVATWKRAWYRPDRILRGRAKGNRGRSTTASDIAGAFAQLMQGRGVMVRPPDHPLGGLGITVLRNHLEIVMLVKGVLIMTWNGSVRVTFEGSLPETVATAVKGRSISELIDHPVLNARPCEIYNVLQAGGMTVVVADARTLPISLSYS